MGGKAGFRTNKYAVAAGAVGLLVCFFVVSQIDATVGTRIRGKSIKGLVTDSKGRPVAGATVYFVDSASIDTTAITNAGMLDGSAEAYDEPLEDIIRDTNKAAALPQAVTNAKGQYRLKGLNAASTYFAYVLPAAADADHLPGGDRSRSAFSPNAAPKGGLNIKVSWATPSDATYIGTTACYLCHTKANFKNHGHQLGFQVPGVRTANQSAAAHPDIDDFVKMFKEATAHTDAGVKVLFFEDYDGTRGFDKFKISEDKTGGGKVHSKAYLWKTAGQYKVTFENVINPADPSSPRTLDVALTYGGAVYKQRLLLSLPGKKGHYVFLQFQGHSMGASKGNNAWYDRTRKVLRDYNFAKFVGKGADGKVGTADDVFTDPAVTDTFEGQCAGCHATGYQVSVDATTSELVASAVPDINGAFDIDGNGQPDEINIGCEQCHGPGSKHRDEAMKPDEGSGRKIISHKAKHIIQPDLLSAERSSQICGRCHERQYGQSTIGLTDTPVSAENKFAPPGISRKEYLEKYVAASRKTYVASEMWPDMSHYKAHRAQYPSWLRSKHARNSKQLVTCADCHDSHGDSANKWFLEGDPKDPNSTLCQRCHAVDAGEHAVEKTGNAMSGSMTACGDCHFGKTASTGAGRPGLILGTPTGASTDANIVYWENDITSHMLDVPSKFSYGTAGVKPGSAMPVPYTGACGACHDASKLQYQGSN